MKKYLESWGGALAFAVAIAGGAWLIAASIGAVRMELVELELRMEARLSAVEAKLDLLIEALDIKVGEDQ